MPICRGNLDEQSQLACKGIEKLPALPGKIFTWVVVLFMICNGLLSAAAMARYTLRQDGREAANVIEYFLDRTYGDEFMEKRWPNMVVTGEE